MLPFFVVGELHGAPDAVGLVVGWYVAATLVVRPFCGLWVDRSGHRVVFATGIVAIAAAGGLYPLADSVTWLSVDRLLVGAGLALVLAAAPLWTVALTPASRGSWALGQVGVISSATLAVSAPLGEVAYRFGGHGAVAAVAAVLPTCGLALLAGVRSVPRAGTGPTGPGRGLTAVVTPVVWPGISLMLTGFGYVAILAFAVVALESQGVAGGSLVLGVYAASFLVVRVTTHRWTERLGVPRTLAVACALEVTGLVALAAAPNLTWAVVGAVLVGAGSTHMYPSLGVEVLAAARSSGRQAGIAVYSSFVQLGMALSGHCWERWPAGGATRRCTCPPRLRPSRACPALCCASA